MRLRPPSIGALLFGLPVALTLLLSLGVVAPRAVRADEVIKVNGTPAVANKFPAEIDFSIDATSTAQITDVVLHYTLVPDEKVTLARADFEPGTTIHGTYVMRTQGNPLYVPPMKTLRYFWTLQDSAGNTKQTDPVDWQYLDTRFTFKTATNGNLTLYYHTGSDSDAQRVLNIGRQAIDKAQVLDGVTVEFPIRVVAYLNQNELSAALSHVSKSFDPNILGQTLAPDIVILAVGNLVGQVNDDTFRHELTHIVNARAVRGGFSDLLPTWIDEGLAVNAQQDPGGFRSAVQAAIRADQVVPIRTLTPSFQGVNADLFYGEAWSITRFLVTNYGPDKMSQLLAAYRDGSRDDDAFSKVYGLDRDGVYNAWRQSVGLQPVPGAAPTQAPSRNQAPAATQGAANPAQAQPTQRSGAVQPPRATEPPASQPQTQPRKSSPDTSDNSTTIVVAIVGGAALVALFGVAIVGGLMLSRRGQR